MFVPEAAETTTASPPSVEPATSCASDACRFGTGKLDDSVGARSIGTAAPWACPCSCSSVRSREPDVTAPHGSASSATTITASKASTTVSITTSAVRAPTLIGTPPRADTCAGRSRPSNRNPGGRSGRGSRTSPGGIGSGSVRVVRVAVPVAEHHAARLEVRAVVVAAMAAAGTGGAGSIEQSR